MNRVSYLRSNIAALALGLLLAAPASAADLFPIPTSGHDQDIVYEVGLIDGAAGANGEIGSRQFYEQGISTQLPAHKIGLSQSITDFTSLITGDTINFDFQPFEQNNILKFTAGTAPKTLTLSTADSYGSLAVVFSGGSLAIGTEIVNVPYTINYVGGATQAGTFLAGDWGNWGATPFPAGTESLIQIGRTGNTTPPVWPVTPEGETTAGRWNVFVSQITTTLPTTNIQSVTFGTPTLNGPTTPLNSGDDVVIFGLAGTGEALVPGDTDGDGVVELSDFDPIRMNFRKPVIQRSQGDLVNNDVVDFEDFRQWKTAFLGAGSIEGLDLSLAAVPEPVACVLFSTAATFAACVRRQRNK